MPVQPKPLEQRFWPRVDKGSTQNGCWLWTGATNDSGYGIIGRGGRGQGNARAHVLSYEWAHGPVPPGTVVCHRCDTPACVNPAHLFAGSIAENNADKDRKGRGVPPPRQKGETNPAAKLDFLDVALVRTLLDEGMSHRRIARELGVAKSTITHIANNQTWAMPGAEAA